VKISSYSYPFGNRSRSHVFGSAATIRAHTGSARIDSGHGSLCGRFGFVDGVVAWEPWIWDRAGLITYRFAVLI
jgi:hypothetical protein